jgi:glutamate N-acetyltransferase/amino-acid N-acetyltransferase
VRIGEVVVFDSGSPRAYDAKRVREIISQPQVWIEVELGLGGGKAHAWGTDLSAEYVRINADYTT